jgi:hypothetical protein
VQNTEHTPDLLRQAASGLRVDDLARLSGVPVATARRRLAHETREAAATEPDAEQSRTIELVHLDLLRRSLMPLALQGDLAATRVLLRLHEDRAVLLGLVDVERAREDDEGVSVVDDLRARRAERRAAARLDHPAVEQ